MTCSCAVVVLAVLLATLSHVCTAEDYIPPQNLDIQQISTTRPFICPDHLFHKTVKVDCLFDNQNGTTFKPHLRVFARSTIDYLLNYTVVPNQGVEFAPAMHVDVMAVQKDDFTDATEYVEAQSPAGDEYVDRLLGIAIDGVPIYTAVGIGGYDVLQPSGSFADIEPMRVDECGGTYGPTPDGNRYHYRTIPSCVLPPLDPLAMWDETKWATQSVLEDFESNIIAWNSGKDVYRSRRMRYVQDPHDLLEAFQGTPGQKSAQVVGWTLEGHPIYSPFNHRGLLHEDLDNCNGKFDETGLYGYYSKPTFPYLVGCVGPGLYSLSEEHATLEYLPTSMHQNRKFTACPGGYVPTALFDSNACEACPAGRYSTATYKKAGQKLSAEDGCRMVCPLGHYCPKASSKPIKCPAGRFGSTLGMKDVACSGACREGYFCPPASTKYDQIPCGVTSFYCPQGSAARLLVDRGFYSVPEVPDPSLRHNQVQCGPGTYCVDGLRFPCPAGRYGTQVELFQKNCSAICPIGHYCPLSSPDPIFCPAGTYGAVTGLKDAACSGPCRPGHYCPRGSIKDDQIPCAPGIYGTEFGLQTKECSPMCEGPGAGAPNSTSSDGTKFCERRDCSAGFYCPQASTHAQQAACGGADKFCPPSSVLPTPVSQGYYTIGLQSKQENMQITGADSDETTRFSQIICEPGFFCISGVRHRCAPGYYGGKSGLFTSTCDGQCNAGYVCPLNSTSPKQQPCGTSANVYCPVGTFIPIEVPAGYYSVGADHTTRESIMACPPGMWCSDGVKRLCAPGRYSSNGSPTKDCDGLCEKGYWCAEGSSDPQEHDCPPGRYGHLGMINAGCKGSCRAGYYCPVNSYSPTQLECGGEAYYCPHGSGARQFVQSGFFSSGGNQTTRELQVKCDIGTYWGTPPAAKARTNLCPDTTIP